MYSCMCTCMYTFLYLHKGIASCLNYRFCRPIWAGLDDQMASLQAPKQLNRPLLLPLLLGRLAVTKASLVSHKRLRGPVVLFKPLCHPGPVNASRLEIQELSRTACSLQGCIETLTEASLKRASLAGFSGRCTGAPASAPGTQFAC